MLIMNYLLAIMSFFVSMSLAMIVIPKILVIAVKHSIYDNNNEERKRHEGAIPRIGGVSFVPCILFSILFVYGLFLTYSNGTANQLYDPNRVEFSFFICGLLLLYLGGVKDDLAGMRYSTKFMIQFISATLVVASGLYINNLYGLFNVYEVSPWIGMPLTVVVIVFVINAMNLIDGMDGLASGISIFALCVYGTLFLLHGAWGYSNLAFGTIGVLIPFYYYNVFGSVKKGSKIFMGDSGSLTLGLILGFLAIRYAYYSPDIIKPTDNTLVIAVSPIIIPLLDVTRVMLSRVKRGKHIFKPDCWHIHHKLIGMGISKSMALLVILCISGGFCLMNFILIRYLNSFTIFAIDIVLWTVLNIHFSRILKKRKAVVNVEKGN